MDYNTIEFMQLVDSAKNCRYCESNLPYGANPLLSVSAQADVVIIGQAPGLAAHKNNRLFSDKSGDRLRDWLQLDSDTFYNARKVAIMPMGFCFPGYKNKADAPPRKECAPKWHQTLLAHIQPRMVVLIGRYAQQYYLPHYPTLTQAIEKQEAKSKYVVLPHPSGRNNRWLVKNPWFKEHYLPNIVLRMKALIK